MALRELLLFSSETLETKYTQCESIENIYTQKTGATALPYITDYCLTPRIDLSNQTCVSYLNASFYNDFLAYCTAYDLYDIIANPTAKQILYDMILNIYLPCEILDQSDTAKPVPADFCFPFYIDEINTYTENSTQSQLQKTCGGTNGDCFYLVLSDLANFRQRNAYLYAMQGIQCSALSGVYDSPFYFAMTHNLTNHTEFSPQFCDPHVYDFLYKLYGIYNFYPSYVTHSEYDQVASIKGITDFGCQVRGTTNCYDGVEAWGKQYADIDCGTDQDCACNFMKKMHDDLGCCFSAYMAYMSWRYHYYYNWGYDFSYQDLEDLVTQTCHITLEKDCATDGLVANYVLTNLNYDWVTSTQANTGLAESAFQTALGYSIAIDYSLFNVANMQQTETGIAIPASFRPPNDVIANAIVATWAVSSEDKPRRYSLMGQTTTQNYHEAYATTMGVTNLDTSGRTDPTKPVNASLVVKKSAGSTLGISMNLIFALFSFLLLCVF